MSSWPTCVFRGRAIADLALESLERRPGGLHGGLDRARQAAPTTIRRPRRAAGAGRRRPGDRGCALARASRWRRPRVEPLRSATSGCRRAGRRLPRCRPGRSAVLPGAGEVPRIALACNHGRSLRRRDAADDARARPPRRARRARSAGRRRPVAPWAARAAGRRKRRSRSRTRCASGSARAPAAPRGGSTEPLRGPSGRRRSRCARRSRHPSPARRSVSITGRRSTSRSPHQPAPSASSAPATPPASGTQGLAFQSNWNA